MIDSISIVSMKLQTYFRKLTCATPNPTKFHFFFFLFFAINLILLIGIKWAKKMIDFNVASPPKKKTKSQKKYHHETMKQMNHKRCSKQHEHRGALLLCNVWKIKKKFEEKRKWNNQTQISGMLTGCVCVSMPYGLFPTFLDPLLFRCSYEFRICWYELENFIEQNRLSRASSSFVHFLHFFLSFYLPHSLSLFLVVKYPLSMGSLN